MAKTFPFALQSSRLCSSPCISKSKLSPPWSGAGSGRWVKCSLDLYGVRLAHKSSHLSREGGWAGVTLLYQLSSIPNTTSKDTFYETAKVMPDVSSLPLGPRLGHQLLHALLHHIHPILWRSGIPVSPHFRQVGDKGHPRCCPLPPEPEEPSVSLAFHLLGSLQSLNSLCVTLAIPTASLSSDHLPVPAPLCRAGSGAQHHPWPWWWLSQDPPFFPHSLFSHAAWSQHIYAFVFPTLGSIGPFLLKKKRHQMYKNLHNIRTFASTKFNVAVRYFGLHSFKTLWTWGKQEIQKTYLSKSLANLFCLKSCWKTYRIIE